MAKTKYPEFPLFFNLAKERYQADFVQHIGEVLQQQEGISHYAAQKKAEGYFEHFITMLYEKRIKGMGEGYRYYSEDDRQQLVRSFHKEVHDFITAFGEVSAQGRTLLWSNFGIGRFAANDELIRQAAGVNDQAQALNDTAIGKLWDKLKLTSDMDGGKIGMGWDRSSQVWNVVSKEFAANAKGHVDVFLPRAIGVWTIFWNVELPELRQRMAPYTDNPQVTGITIHRLTEAANNQIGSIAKDESISSGEKDQRKRELMRQNGSWENIDISQAPLDIPGETGERRFMAVVEEVLKKKPSQKKPLTMDKMQQFAQKWRNTAKEKSRSKR